MLYKLMRPPRKRAQVDQHTGQAPMKPDGWTQLGLPGRRPKASVCQDLQDVDPAPVVGRTDHLDSIKRLKWMKRELWLQMAGTTLRPFQVVIYHNGPFNCGPHISQLRGGANGMRSQDPLTWKRENSRCKVILTAEAAAMPEEPE